MEGGPTVEVAVTNAEADILDRVIRVSSRAEMQAYDVGAGYQFSLEEGWRSGMFVIKSGTSPSDPQEGVYVVLDNGNYAMRRYDGITGNGGINMAWFGVEPDGSTDNTATGQAAIDFISSGKVFLPAGSILTNRWYVNKSGLHFEGAGENSTIITHTATTGDAITVSDTSSLENVTFRNISFNTSVTKTYGYYISLDDTYYAGIYNCTFNGGYSGILITGKPSWFTRIADVRIAGVSENGIVINANTGGQGCVDVVLDNIFVTGQSSSVETKNGILIEAAGDLTIKHFQNFYCTTGMRVTPDSAVDSQRVQALFVSDSFFDAGTGSGIIIDPRNSAEVQLFKLYDTWCASSGSDGIILGLGTGSIKQTDITNIICSAHAGKGLLLNPVASRTRITNSSFSANTDSGISVAADVSDFEIINCTCGPSGQFGGNAGRGILINTGTSNNFVIANTNVTGNTLAGLNNFAFGVNQKIHDNIGYDTFNRGSATMAAGNTSVSVSHGLESQPAKEDIQVTLASNPQGALYWVSAVSSTTFDISIDAAVAGAIYFGWAVGIEGN